MLSLNQSIDDNLFWLASVFSRFSFFYSYYYFKIKLSFSLRMLTYFI